LEPKYKDWLKATESWLTHFKHDICKELAKNLEKLTRGCFIFPKAILGKEMNVHVSFLHLSKISLLAFDHDPGSGRFRNSLMGKNVCSAY